MTDTSPIPSPSRSVFGAEIRLNSGQYVNIQPGGTVQVIAPPPPPETYTYKLVAAHPEVSTPLTVRAEDYNSLVDFFKQLEHLGYGLVNMERVEARSAVQETQHE